MRIPLALVVLAGVARADALEPDDLQPPPAEHGRALVVDLPAVPDFVLPPGVSVRLLRVRGAKLLDSRVVIHGVVTWVYDCAKANRVAGETDRALAKRIGDDPTLCERPKFYLGDTAQTPAESSLWVVDVPRPYNKLELDHIAKADRTAPDRCEPGAKISVCPPYRVGDVVTVAGDFKLSSRHSERNSDGLLVFGAMKNETLHWETPGSTWPTAAPVAPPAPAAAPVPRVAPAATPAAKPMRAVVDPRVREDSLVAMRSGNRAAGSKQLDEAVKLYTKAITGWPGNHVAWYGLGGAYAMRAQWREAVEAFEHAVALRQDVAQYQMWLGVAMYERSVAAAREDQARKENRRPEEVAVDLSTINFERAAQHLQAALALDPAMWRAHYYAGKQQRAASQAREAAESFSAAIHANVREVAPYIALGELYRKWDYADQAIAIATLGTLQVPASADAADVWFVLGMAYDDKRQDADAIVAFTKALDVAPDNAKAKYQRGQAYFRIKDRANAKRDLEDFLRSAGPAYAFAKQQAQAMLMDLAAKH